MQPSEAIVAPKASGAMVWIYRKADMAAGYPGAFIRHGIQGSVNAKFRFDAEGRFDRSRLDVTSESPYLRVYVYRLLEKTFFDDPIPPAFRNWKDQLRVEASVRFDFVETMVKLELADKIAGNRIYLRRTHSRGNEGPFRAMGRFAVGVDLAWFAQKQGSRSDLLEYENDPLFAN